MLLCDKSCCSFCFPKVSGTSEIKEQNPGTDEDAICPKCGIDSVI